MQTHHSRGHSVVKGTPAYNYVLTLIELLFHFCTKLKVLNPRLLVCTVQ